MPILCPHCDNPVAGVKFTSCEKIACPTCGSIVRLQEESNADLPGRETLSPDSHAVANTPPAHQTATTSYTPGPVAALAPELQQILTPPQQPGELGRLGSYRILGILGQGGMGAVFEADDPDLRRRVALKVIRPALISDTAARQRFLREARAAAALQNDHVIPVYHVGEDNGVPFLVMPLLPGETLEARLRRDVRVPLAEILQIGREVAEGLAAAHAGGLIHRDIKPANLWLESLPGQPGNSSSRFRVKILDFGLARPVETKEEVTMWSGVVAGSPGYLSPEQANAEPLDARSDLFSLGCVLYRMAAGRSPFKGDSFTAALRAVVEHNPQPPDKVNPAVPLALSELVMRLLAKRREDRPGTAGDVASRLAAMGRPLTTETASWHGAKSPPGSGRPGRRLWLAAVVGLLCLGLTLPILFRSTPPPPPPLKGMLDVRLWEKGNPLRDGLRLDQPRALPLRVGDLLRVEAEVNRPAYFYVVWLDSQGKATPLYPWQDEDWQKRPSEERRDRLALPPSDGKGAPLGAGHSGIETLLLLVREEPLPAGADADLSALFHVLPEQRGPVRLHAAAWFENGELVRDEANRSAMQIGQAQAIDDPVMQTQSLLRSKLRSWFGYTRAVCFSFQGE